ncbi:MAG: A/G-specific adenine glycosylase [Methanosarcinales archaeon]|jgi:A/G-specific adenine glycosylase|nr:A/G-specific adenine glycosylase [Methanosarcinales archaeon]
MKILSADKKNSVEDEIRSVFSSALLGWYDRSGRDLPWRVRGAHPNPYIVWAAEIMLQQTTVKTVIPYFYRFMEKFPDIQTLAEADIEGVLLMWQGLGYYTRARKLHECAKYLTANRDGKFPETYAELLKLPGIGPYTAASISSLAFDKREAVVDGNVIRVISRLYGILETVSLPDIQKKAQNLMPEKRAADYTSAIMDLGAVVCTPKNPNCGSCPFQENCAALRNGMIDKIPLIQKLQKTGKTGKVFWIENETGGVFIQKRTEKGLLHGLTEFPWSAVVDSGDNSGGDKSDGVNESGSVSFPIAGDWTDTGKSVRHVFTHIRLELHIFKIRLSKEAEASFLNQNSGFFVPESAFSDFPFSTLMKKIILEVSKQDPPKKGIPTLSDYF